jgi:protease I
VKPEEYDAVFMAGGRGPEYIRIDKRVQEIVRRFHEAGKPIFTICHGVQVLMAVDGLLKGARSHRCNIASRKCASLEASMSMWNRRACADGNLVSAKGWPGLAAFMRECLKALGTSVHYGETKQGPVRKVA